MPGEIVVAVLTVVVLVIGSFGLWLSRRHTLDRRVGSFRCGLRHGARWPSGVAQYGAASLYWWRSSSLAPRPARRWERQSLTIVSRRAAEGPGAGQLVVTCHARSNGKPVEFELRLSPEAYAGLTSWIEATPSRVGSVI
ncbi:MULTISPECIES: DUF2550 domain-containing protein [Cellulomonas]|uniref:DUF2550 domain-containing protein n=1 Tax=Cellulomonas gelida TaxID=1712 RepID=A0A4Y3KFS2_9CELL|nr:MULTISPECIES: DUF2550 domain-containing protein [Cellulomonas]MCR6705939.1 DUF2550 domain-containing protein [Cellulomonas sp.]GEA83311.1 hypothetical protein CGE01nite_05620 [Cellulomonas gelida]GGL13508.1 hypothetical protein GCM10009774_00240 [Cellulomonas gelida]